MISDAVDGESNFVMARKPHTHPVLLIDDSHEDLFMAKRLLARTGIKHPIVTIDSGDEAIVFLRASMLPGAEQLLPCIVFCDVRMPGQSGFDVLKWVRQQKPLEKLPFVMLTGENHDTDKARAAQLGATGYLVKFPTPEKLQNAIDAALEEG